MTFVPTPLRFLTVLISRFFIGRVDFPPEMCVKAAYGTLLLVVYEKNEFSTHFVARHVTPEINDPVTK